jgi:hypothetical protein
MSSAPWFDNHSNRTVLTEFRKREFDVCGLAFLHPYLAILTQYLRFRTCLPRSIEYGSHVLASDVDVLLSL